MSRMIQLLILLSAPLALLVAAFVVDRTFSAAEDGENYDYVVRFDLPSVDAPVDLPKVDGPPMPAGRWSSSIPGMAVSIPAPAPGTFAKRPWRCGSPRPFATGCWQGAASGSR